MHIQLYIHRAFVTLRAGTAYREVKNDESIVWASVLY